MKKISIISLGLLSSLSVTGQVKTDRVEIKRTEDKAQISFQAEIAPKTVKSNEKEILTPVIYNGTETAMLSPILIQGRRSRIMDQRNRVTPPAGAIIATDGETIRYNVTVPYQMWFNGSSLRFERKAYGCGKKQEYNPVTLARNLVVTGDDVVSVMFGNRILILEKNATLAMDTCAVTSGTVSMPTFEIYFTSGSSQPDLYNLQNNSQMDRLIKVLRLGSAPFSGQINITGYASPSGSYNVNRLVAEKRAFAVRNYLLDNVPNLKFSDFRVVNGGENWGKLLELVDASSMPGRWQVADVIRNVPEIINYATNTSRKKALMDLNGGSTWNYMRNNFFPQLTIATVEYIAPATEETPKAVLINTAIDLIGERKATEALAILTEVESDSRAWNPMGVAYLLLDDIAKAREYFTKAVEAGYNNAKMNLEQL